MTRLTTGIIGIVLLLSACSGKKTIYRSRARYKRFEISYASGWTKDFSFWTDSTKVFLSPFGIDSMKYGILTDSIIRLIDTTLPELFSDTTIKSENRRCSDCSVVDLYGITGKDTISIYQAGAISGHLWPIIQTIRYLIDSIQHEKVHSILFLRTQEAISPPLPPILYDGFNSPSV
jgi:hypothetical protein